MNYCGLNKNDIANGEGVRVSLFVSGCRNHCKGCHNPQTHDFEGGTVTTTDELLEKIKNNPLLDGVTFSGGEPFCQSEALAVLGREIKKLGLNIITYTGYTFEKLYEERSQNHWKDLLEVTDYLIDGPFILEQKDWEIKFRGSSNQRYIDCQDSLKKGTVIETEP